MSGLIDIEGYLEDIETDAILKECGGNKPKKPGVWDNLWPADMNEAAKEMWLNAAREYTQEGFFKQYTQQPQITQEYDHAADAFNYRYDSMVVMNPRNFARIANVTC